MMKYDFIDIFNKLKFLPYPLRLQYANFISKNPKNLSLKKISERIKKHEPIEYILHVAEFYNQKFYVNRNVLIPRKETEEIIDIAKKYITKLNIETIIDVGTGSGCIIITLAKLLITKQIKFIGIDISKNALKVTNKNLKIHNIENKILLINKDFRKFNFKMYKNVLVCANLPYIPPKMNLAKSVVKYEPHIALYGKGKKGDALIKKIIKIYKKNDNIKGLIIEKNNGIIKHYIKQDGITNKNQN